MHAPVKGATIVSSLRVERTFMIRKTDKTDKTALIVTGSADRIKVRSSPGTNLGRPPEIPKHTPCEVYTGTPATYLWINRTDSFKYITVNKGPDKVHNDLTRCSKM